METPFTITWNTQNGAAGNSVVEMLSVPGGASTVTPSFQGQFSAWFIDGTSFLTTQGTTVRVYSSAAVQQNILTVASLNSLGGAGHWFWTQSTYPGLVNVYAVGAGSDPPPAYTYPTSDTVVGSGTTLGLVSFQNAAVTVVDFSGATPIGTTYATPIQYNTAYAATSATSWLVGNRNGVVMDGSQLPGQSRFLNYGKALSIAGGIGQFAIATASGRILYFDSATNAQLGTIPAFSSSLSISTDGSVLAVASNIYDCCVANADLSVRIYSLPSGALANTIPYTYGVTSYPTHIKMSGSGTVLAEFLSNAYASPPCFAQLIRTVGGAPIWCATTGGVYQQLALSPDGSLLAASTGCNGHQCLVVSPTLPSSTTNIYKDGALVTTINGWAPGWIDNKQLLVLNYVCADMQCDPKYTGATIYDGVGMKLTAFLPPELPNLQSLTSTSVYSFSLNEVVSTANGAVLWASGDDSLSFNGYDESVPIAAVAGSEVVFVSGTLVLTQPY